MSDDKTAERKKLSLEISEIVHAVAARLVDQVIETITESHITPRRRAILALWEDAKELYHGSGCAGIGKPDEHCDCGLVNFQNKFEALVNEVKKP